VAALCEGGKRLREKIKPTENEKKKTRNSNTGKKLHIAIPSGEDKKWLLS